MTILFRLRQEYNCDVRIFFPQVFFLTYLPHTPKLLIVRYTARSAVTSLNWAQNHAAMVEVYTLKTVSTLKWNWNNTVSKLFCFSFIPMCGQFNVNKAWVKIRKSADYIRRGYSRVAYFEWSVKPKFHLLRHVTSRHVMTRQPRRVVRVVTWRDVSCRACCAVLVPTWRTTKKQYIYSARL